jgi:hypothetical protein
VPQQPYEYVPPLPYPRPRIRFDAIPEAWGLLQQQMGTWVVATFLMIAFPLAIYAAWFVLIGVAAGGFASRQGHGPPSDAVGAIIVVSVIILMLALWIVSTLTMGGMFRMAVRQVKGEPISPADIFSAIDTLPALLGSSILIALAGCAGAIMCIIPAYIVQGMLMLTHPLVLDQRMGAFDAVSSSWHALKEDMLMATLFHFALAFVASLGIFCCGVGLIFTFPMLPLGVAIIYRDFFQGPAFGHGAYAPPPGSSPPPPPPSENVEDYEA